MPKSWHPARFQALRALGFGVILCALVRIALGGLAALDAVSGRAACGNQEDADGDGDVRHVNAGLSVGGACRGRGDGHGLSLVVDILMLRYGNVRGLAVDIALFGQLLEDNQCMTVEGGCIELAEVDGDRAALTVRRELEFGGHALIGNLQRLAGLLIHERCMERVLLAGDKTLVLHLVSDDSILASHQFMVTVGLVSRGGTDGTRGEFYRLSLVVLIAFARDDGNGSLIGSVLDAALEHDLEDHEVLGLAGQAVDNVVGVEGVVHVDGTGLLLRGELRRLVDKAGEEVFVLLGICLDLGKVDGSGRELLCVRPVDTVIGNLDLIGLVGFLDITDEACAGRLRWRCRYPPDR